jgi:hypothetical protein
VDGIEVWSVVCSGTAASTSTLFPGCVWLPWGFIGSRKFWQAFFKFFPDGFLPGTQISEAGIQAGWKVATRYGASRLKSRRIRAIFFREQL